MHRTHYTRIPNIYFFDETKNMNIYYYYRIQTLNLGECPLTLSLSNFSKLRHKITSVNNKCINWLYQFFKESSRYEK